MRRFLSLLLCLLFLAPAACAAGIGQSYKAFEASYAENVVFINENTGRMLLPHSLERDYDKDGDRMYRINRGALALEMHMDDSGERIARLIVTLTAPANLKQGTTEFTDFATAGYHSYALLMAMSDAETVLERYSLVEQVNWGIKQYGGVYEMNVGDYTLTCKSEGSVATMTFTCPLDHPAETLAPEIDIIDPSPQEEGDSLAG